MPVTWRAGLVLCLVFLVLGTPGLVDAAPTVKVRIPSKVEIEGEKILLGAIAHIQGLENGLKQDLRSVVIGKAPLPETTRHISRDYILVRLKQNHINISKVELSCPEEIEISRSSIEISQHRLEEIVLDFIRKRAPWKSDEFKVENVRVDDSVLLPKGNITYEVVFPKNRDFLGTLPLSIVFKVHGSYEKRVWATVTIEVFKEVVVTKRRLRRFQVIKESDIEMKRMNLAGLPSNVVRNIDQVVGKRTKRLVNALEVLRNDMVEYPPLVKRGDVVTIIAESEGLRVTALGIVKERGHKGERIMVSNFDSKKEVYARILDSSTVEVDF